MSEKFYRIGPLVIKTKLDIRSTLVEPQQHNATISLVEAVVPAPYRPAPPEDCLWTDGGVWLFYEGIEIAFVSPTGDATIACSPDEVQFYLYLLRALRVLAVQRGAVLLHASAVIKQGAAFLWVGHSGSGKSTRAAVETLRGAALSNDDIVPILLDAQGRACTFQIDPFVHLHPAANASVDIQNLPQPHMERGDGKSLYHLGEADPHVYPISKIEWLMSPGVSAVLDGSKSESMRVLLHQIVGRGMIQRAVGSTHLAMIAKLLEQIARSSSEKNLALV